MPEECANPLLLGWLKEWLEEERARMSKGVATYKKAYESMKACPITFDHPSEAKILHGFGEKICNRLTEELKEYCKDNGLPPPQLPHKGKRRPSLPEPEQASPSPPKKQRSSKPYVPILRSGAYAILLALSELPEGERSGLTKLQVIDAAQPHCDSSFTAPSDPTKYFTAWKSMQTLEKKELVCNFGRPNIKYALTEEGWQIARGIRKTAETSKGALEHSTQPQGTAAPAEEPLIRRRPSSPITSQSSKELVSFGDPWSEVEQIAQAIRASLADASVQSSSNAPPQNTLTHSEKLARARRLLETFQESSTRFPPSTAAQASVELRQNQATFQRPQNTTSEAPIALEEALESINYDLSPHTSAPKAMHPKPLDNSGPLSPFRIKPGSFTIELILDNREVRSTKDRDYIAEELKSRGVTPIVRPLDLGDAMWVAKCKDPRDLARLGEEGDEIMLDWIVERKRLDDLIGSIKDGRFLEQKFRLKRSGVKNVVYVIEDITMDLETSQRYEESVMSAIASTQVVDGFFVKRTKKLDDTIRYLARMTMILKNMYQSQQLLVIPSERISPTTYLPLLASLSTPHYITQRSFSYLVSKSEVLTLRDVFLKMLMCTRGITGPKALELQKHWPTPRAFIEALEQCGTSVALDNEVSVESKTKMRREMVWRVAGELVGSKKIGKTVSANLGDVWGTPHVWEDKC